MFGEKEMLAVKNVVVDYKSRIVLPTYTNASVGEELIVRQVNDYMEILSKKIALKELKELKKDLRKYIACKTIYDEYLESIIQEVRVGSGRRITLTGFVIPEEKYRVVGAIDRVRAYKISK